MNYKPITIIVFVLVVFKIQAQQLYVTYFYQNNSGLDVFERYDALRVNGKEALYKYLKTNDTITETQTQIDDDGNMIVRAKAAKPWKFVYTNFETDSMYLPEGLFGKLYILSEKVPKIKWSILNEFKTISSYKCQKAIGYFRGRTYTAWFTTNIPTQFGPWKLHGLPGLIIEAFDDKKQIKYLVHKIDFNTDVLPPFKRPYIGNTTPLKAYISEIRPKKFKEFSEMLNAQSSDRQTTVSPFEIVRETANEVIYEWEEN